MTERNKSLLILHFTILVFGFTGILGKFISLDSEPLVWARMGLAMITLLLYHLFIGKNLKLRIRDVFSLLLIGVLIAIHWVTFFGSIKVSNVSIALACLSSGAFFTSLIEPWARKVKINMSELLMGMAVIGALIMIFNFETDYRQGIILGITSALFGAVFTVLNSFYVQRINAATVTFYEMAGGLLALSIILPARGGFTLKIFKDLPATEWLALISLATICTAFAFVAFVFVMKQLSAFTVTLSVNLEPIYSILLAFYFFGEYNFLTPQFFFGAFVILFTVVLNAWLKAKALKKLALIKSND